MGEYQWLANFGFAAVVAVLVLTRVDKSLKELTKSVQTLGILVAKISGQDVESAQKFVIGGGSNS
jgi:hypothetical protein